MRWRWLKFLRVAAAVVVLGGLAGAFLDFRGAMPAAVGHALASAQLVPSLMALVTGASFAVAGLVILAVTLAVGRIYCSALCPLGILQDGIARVAGWFRRRTLLLPHRRALTWVRQGFLWATVGGIVAGWAGLTLTLLDPYSIFGRIVSGLFRPAITVVNNALVGLSGSLGIEGLYRVTPQWAGVGALAVPAAMLVLIVGMAAWRGRLYCNTVCPVGTLLGFISARGAFRLTLDQSVCRKCGDCLHVCKAQCIDLRAGVIDHSRCVGCYNCIGACDQHGIRHRWSWGGRKMPIAPKPLAARTTSPLSVDPQRRAFISTTVAAVTAATGAGALLAVVETKNGKDAGATASGPAAENASRAICPPGSESVERFLDRCTACHLCVSACPTHVLQPAWLEYGIGGLLKPRLDYAAAFCNFDCQRCAEVCPDGAITLLSLAQKQVTRIGVAVLTLDNCIVKTKGTDCAACSEHCPTKAVDTAPYGDNLRLPQVNPELCIGCGACEYACPAQPKKAIVVSGQRRHEVAVRKIEEKAVDPRAPGGFPF